MKIVLERDDILEAIKEFINVRFTVDSRTDQIDFQDDYGRLRGATWDSNKKEEDQDV